MSAYDEIKPLMPAQYKESVNINNLLQIITEQFDDLKVVNNDLASILDYQMLEGKLLDLLGSIIRETRNGAGDDTYKTNISNRIAQNTSTGQVNQVLQIVATLTKSDLVIYSDNPPASFTLFINGQEIPENFKSVIDKISNAGVSLLIYASYDGSKPIILIDKLDKTELLNLIDNNNNNIIIDTSENLCVSKIGAEDNRVFLTHEGEEIILLESGAAILGEDFFQNGELKTDVISNYDLFNGVKFGYLSLDSFLDNNGNNFVTNEGFNFKIQGSTIISEGKLPILI